MLEFSRTCGISIFKSLVKKADNKIPTISLGQLRSEHDIRTVWVEYLLTFSNCNARVLPFRCHLDWNQLSPIWNTSLRQYQRQTTHQEEAMAESVSFVCCS